MRAVSTVLDVTLFLLLVGAAIATLTVPAPDPPESTADETAEQLAVTTANVTERLGDVDRRPAVDRRVAGTAATLLARAALANLSLDGHQLTPTTADYRESVREQLRRSLAWAPDRTHVTATWRPYPDAPLQGRSSVGPRPPPRASVGTASVRVPVPVASVSIDESPTFRSLARKASGALLAVTVPSPEERASRRLRARERRRIAAYAAALEDVTERSPDRIDRVRLRNALATRLERDMRRRFADPNAAAAALETGTVRIVVREWET